MTLGEFIKDYRKAHEMSQAVFAAASGISKGYISMLEQNKNPATGLPIAPSIDVFGRVAAVVGISLNELMRLVDFDQPISLVISSAHAPVREGRFIEDENYGKREGSRSVYKNLRALRESLAMTQKEFAASLGIKHTTYSGYETGDRDPKSEFWIDVAQKYGVTIDYLMGYSDDPYKTGREAPVETKKSPDAEESAPEDDAATRAELIHMLTRFGFIGEDQQLSDRDLAFLENVFRLMGTWFDKSQ